MIVSVNEENNFVKHVIYADASGDMYGYYVGYVVIQDDIVIEEHTEKTSITNTNMAELRAVRLAEIKFPKSLIFTDNDFAAHVSTAVLVNGNSNKARKLVHKAYQDGRKWLKKNKSMEELRL